MIGKERGLQNLDWGYIWLDLDQVENFEISSHFEPLLSEEAACPSVSEDISLSLLENYPLSR